MAPNKISIGGASGMEEVREIDPEDDMVQEILRAAQKVRPVKNGVLVVPPNDRDWEGATGEEILRDILTETGVLPSEAKASWTGIFRRIGGPLTDMGRLLIRKLRGE